MLAPLSPIIVADSPTGTQVVVNAILPLMMLSCLVSDVTQPTCMALSDALTLAHHPNKSILHPFKHIFSPQHEMVPQIYGFHRESAHQHAPRTGSS